MPLHVRMAQRGGRAGDRWEREADAMADRVMRGDAAPSHDVGAATPVAGHDGQALPQAARNFFEPRFGHDFSQVRVHADGESARAADSIRARAYTLGTDIVFGAHEYDPHGDAGRRLLAHELAHVVQQSEGAPRAVQAKLRAEDPGDALPGAPPRQKWEDVRDYVRTLSGGDFDVSSAGAVAPTSAAVCAAPVRESNKCLCDLHASADDWKIKIDDIAWPHTEEANKRVTVHSTRSPIEFGAWGGGAQSGQRISQDNPRVLGHELCGHAWLMERHVHPTDPLVFSGGQLMGRPGHDDTVAIENTVANEMTPGAPTRGSFADPHHGESFARITISGYASGTTGTSTLPPDMQARLVRAKDAMATAPEMRADIVGHADHTGSAAANASTSLARARGVRAHLTGLGVTPSKFMEVVGHGDSECPAGAADNPACRKVEILMFMFQSSSIRNP